MVFTVIYLLFSLKYGKFCRKKTYFRDVQINKREYVILNLNLVVLIAILCCLKYRYFAIAPQQRTILKFSYIFIRLIKLALILIYWLLLNQNKTLLSFYFYLHTDIQPSKSTLNNFARLFNDIRSVCFPMYCIITFSYFWLWRCQANHINSLLAKIFYSVIQRYSLKFL